VSTGACEVYRDRLVEAATGTVPPEVLADLRVHLAACEGCRAEWEELCEAAAWLREVPEPPVPVGFWEELDRRLRRTVSSDRRRARWTGAARAVGVAALVALAALRWVAPQGPTPEAPLVSPAVRALMPQVAELVRAWSSGMEGEPW
jgi:anti-sigma factor RsiW